MLKDRKHKRNAAELFARVISTDKQGRVASVEVPGSKNKTYKVILRRPEGAKIETECLLCTSIGLIPDKGNSHKTICYHSMAAVDIAAHAMRGQTHWCESQTHAENIARMVRGQVVPVTSRQSKQALKYVVFSLPKQKDKANA